MTSSNYQASRILAIDTSTSSMSIAVLHHGQVIAEHHTHAERNHSIGLLPNIQQLLATLELKLKDFDAIAVGQGPGSYTGVRIGVSAAKTLAWSLGLDLLGVSSLEAMALGGGWKPASDQQGKGPVRWIIPLMDARRSQAFTAVYEDRGSAVNSLSEAVWRNIMSDGIRVMQPWTEQLLALATSEEQRRGLADVSGLEAPQEIVFVGETEGFTAQIEQLSQKWTGIVRVSPYSIEAGCVGRLAYPRLKRGERAEVHTFAPNYTQLTEAEVNLLAKQNQQAQKEGDA